MILKWLVFFICLQFEVVGSCNIRPNATNCEPYWNYFARKSGGWCTIFVGVSEMNRTKAEKSCTDFGAVPSSIENEEMKNAFMSSLDLWKVEGMWIGASIKTECNCGSDSCKLTPGCGSEGYIWNDKYTYPNDLLDSVQGITNTEISGITYTTSYDSVYLANDGTFRAIWNSTILRGIMCGKPATY